ncbi:hypothetical protein [Atrimonas thermophila]|jgi:hypothetical protein|uniref:hypothetical protein n=1 Tax=Atrimonas thermophila TaxID=3064161 RepID=UPI00399D15C6
MLVPLLHGEIEVNNPKLTVEQAHSIRDAVQNHSKDEITNDIPEEVIITKGATSHPKSSSARTAWFFSIIAHRKRPGRPAKRLENLLANNA